MLGNGKYENVPELGNPANDAQDLAQALRKVGFDVIEQHDATREAMAKAVHDFSDRLAGAEVALFFYAGHGLQMNGENYLLPVDAKIQNAADVRFNTINLTDIQQEMESAGRANIIILDACRNNPFADKLAQSGRSIAGRGLARLDAAGQGSLIVYSTQPNNTAFDGAGRNSPFTAALLNHVATPGLEVRQMISRVRGDVLAATDQKQTPWDSSSLVGDVYLAGPPASPAAAATAKQAQTPDTQATPAVRTQPAATASEPANDCDRIAASRPPSSSAGNRDRKEPDWAAAVPACEAMIKAQPAEMRFVDELGHAQEHLKNYAEAARNYRIASEAGYPEAQLNLGVLYYDGHGLLQNYTTAFELFNKVAAGAPSIITAKAMANVGAMYADGRGVAKDDAKSLDFEERSVEMGNPNALRLIAIHYFNGAGVARDYQMAAQYMQQAVDIGRRLRHEVSRQHDRGRISGRAGRHESRRIASSGRADRSRQPRSRRAPDVPACVGGGASGQHVFTSTALRRLSPGLWGFLQPGVASGAGRYALLPEQHAGLSVGTALLRTLIRRRIAVAQSRAGAIDVAVFTQAATFSPSP